MHMLTIRCNRVIQVVAILYVIVAGVGPFLAGLALGSLPREQGRTDPMVHVGVSGVLNLLFAICVLREVRGASVVFSEERVEQFSPWCGRTTIPWGEVEKVVVYGNGFVVIRGAKRQVIAFSLYWTHRAAIMAMIQRQVGPKLKHSAL
jgi:hypothetical protein